MEKNKILEIGMPYLDRVENDTQVRLCADLHIDGEKVYTLWYQTDIKYQQFLCTERSDAFVVTLLLYAMEHKLDIVCAQAMSEKLHYQLTEYLIPAMSRNISKYHDISIKAKCDPNKLPSQNAVAASLSCGVDSFYTLLRHLDREEKSNNISHLTFFNAGASGDFGGEKARELYKARIEWIQDAAIELGKDLVCVDSNMNEFLMQIHVDTHTFRTLSIPLALQKLFSIYYFASGFNYSDFKIDAETAMFNPLNVPCLSTENLTFYLSGSETDRQGKLSYISQFPITYSKLNVCVKDDANCSKCSKCRRTMLGLYAQNKLDLYKDVFDLEYFNSHKKEYLNTLVFNRDRLDWDVVYKDMKKQGFSVDVLIVGNTRYVCRKIRETLAKNPTLKRIYRMLKDSLKRTSQISKHNS